jgi:hypothetical protein
MPMESRFRWSLLAVMLAFSLLLVIVGVVQWSTTGRIVPLAPGLLMLSSALVLANVARKQP